MRLPEPVLRAARRATLVCVALTLAAAPLGASAAESSPGAVATARVPVASLDPEAQAAVLSPLRAAAAALDGAGRRALAGVWAGVAIDADADQVEVWLTDPSVTASLLALAGAQDPGLARQRLVVHPAAFPLVALDRASRAAMALRVPGDDAPYAAHPAPDAAGVVVEVGDPARWTGLARVAGVPVSVVAGTPRQPHDWDAVKWHDSAPFIGGDVLTPDGRRYCTAGLPAVRKSDGRAVLVTAAHCFAQGQRVYTGAGRTWDYGNGRTGAYVGTVTGLNRTWDAETIVGADNNADESDTDGWKPLTSVAYSYRGDYVCHAGAKSAAKGHPTPCGIKVTDDDLYFREGGHTVRGVEGVDVNGWGSVGGDSGGTVFAVGRPGERQLRGMVSSGGADGTDDQRRVDWPEAVDVFRALGLKLNPVR